ncbi:M24 family metallopeptidase C-terminal domain-containing protein, partial [Pseudomonas syringae group genomosp. 7]|uniref:M24 family metallopeptidase C-terminal domain-containing protein n=1 Tax=Pseudomonas syringae group genomosp. 7 TaxID=251699 RepID=UPI00377071EA
RWGVRKENLVNKQEASTTEFGEILRIETLTLCPIDTRCIEFSMLNEEERTWLNDYHAQVLARLIPLLQGTALLWLQARTLA